MKYLVLALCFHFGQWLTEAETLDAWKAEEIPMEAQALSGLPLVEYLQKNQKLFEVTETPVRDFEYKLMDPKFTKKKRPPVVDDVEDNGNDIPKSYDARIQWANCSSLFYIRDQANCGSCWAVSTAAAMSDRICIASKGATQVLISAQDIVSCCTWCGAGCEGGWPIEAWKYGVTEGVVTGGNFGRKECCRSYEIHPCGYHGNEPFYGHCHTMARTPPCKKRCRPGYKNSYMMDKRYGTSAYELPNSVTAIQRDIMENGPVVAGFDVYEDFKYYKSGIYRHTAGKQTGGHAVKVIGWGEEKIENETVPYWIVANSWHDDWGENGFYRMIRGINDCGFEQEMVGGLI